MSIEIKNKFKRLVESKIFKKIIYILGIIIIFFLIFQIGFWVGVNKESFGRDWNNRYFDNFGPGQGGSLTVNGNLDNARDFPNANGAIGRIIKIEFPTVIVLDDKDKVEKIVLINDDTEIREMREKINNEDLKVDDFIVVIGSPNVQGQIEAKLIRVLPSPSPESSLPNTTDSQSSLPIINNLPVTK